MLLFFDTETNGKANFNAPPSDPSQPWLVQLAAKLMSPDLTRVVSSVNLIVNPAGRFSIPDEVAKIHGIDQFTAASVGTPVRTVLSTFTYMCEAAEMLLAYNIDFDDMVMEACYRREGRAQMPWLGKKRCCVMKLVTPMVKIPKPDGWKKRKGDEYKWPTLTEAHKHFFGEAFEGAHDAMNDVDAMIRVYREATASGLRKS